MEGLHDGCNDDKVENSHQEDACQGPQHVSLRSFGREPRARYAGNDVGQRIFQRRAERSKTILANRWAEDPESEEGEDQHDWQG
eukprot:CAMPEP_0180687534 /NCGR_PEP_ID=MMETSP1037_2-20121125/73513_1 /TAXON_ID=632150 /ORGANISM="Azadinium spinosum, Strain 3D9" /LENGTH=83 /DNA_ID=CAMNT_0022718343 /DNA_START=323 /DNA_END=574 /DNA_ORIENTATION=+